MKRYLIFMGVVCAFLSSCSKAELEPDNAVSGTKLFYAEVPSEDTKTYIDTDYEIHWTADDRISVFCSPANEQYRFTGGTGAQKGTFENLSIPATPTYGHNYAVYPYQSANSSISEGTITVTLPSVQTYAGKSFGPGANTMVAVTQNTSDDIFKFRNVCGYLMLKLYGGDRIKSITLRGNGGEKIAGAATITAGYDADPAIVMGETATTEITLNCPEEGVPTNESEESFTQFWIAVPPTTFTGGFTIEITNTDNDVISRSTSSSVTIHRNRILKMAPVKVDTQNAHELLSFSLTNGVHIYNPIEFSDSRIVLVAPNGEDFSSLTVSFTYNGVKVLHNGEEQTSGISKIDFSASTAPEKFEVYSKSGSRREYDVYLFDLPVLFVDTPDKQSIKSKTVWIEGTLLKLYSTDGKVAMETETNIKGRGNTTWGYPKKPYALKLSKKESFFGIPKDKRWNLLANWADRTLMRNAIAFAISEKSKDLEWTPRGGYVELFLNGVHQGNYYLCEHLKVSKDRVNITEINTATDIEGDALTGGYFLEIDGHYDEPYKFRSALRNLPIVFKNPDEDVKDVQLNYVKDYINNLERCLADGSRFSSREYMSYLDIDTFIDYFLVHELTEYGGPMRPFSSHVYKDRLDVLKAGPIWDFDRDSFYFPVATNFINNSGLWYNYLFRDPLFVSRLKEKWNESKNSFYDVNLTIDYYKNYIKRSAVYNNNVWPTSSRDNGDETLPFSEAADRMKTAYNARFDILDNLINSLTVN